MKKILISLALLLFFGLGVWLTQKYFSWQETQIRQQSQVLLEKVKSVYQLVTVEGYFSEVYDYQDYWGYNLSPFRKKALIRVKAKVSVGYDLENLKIQTFPDEKILVISQLPEPQILSIDHDLDYYDLTEGTFNSFSIEDYNRLNTNAKQFIIKKAEESDLLESAKDQSNQALEMMRFMVENAGWQLEVRKGLVLPETLEELTH